MENAAPREANHVERLIEGPRPNQDARFGREWPAGRLYGGLGFASGRSPDRRVPQQLAGEAGDSKPALQVKFGPSAWFANEKDEYWKKSSPANADYLCLFLTTRPAKEVRQSAVTLQDVLDGIAPGDFRLRDEIVGLIRESVQVCLEKQAHDEPITAASTAPVRQPAPG